jgi:hypothetical protein
MERDGYGGGMASDIQLVSSNRRESRWSAMLI